MGGSGILDSMGVSYRRAILVFSASWRLRVRAEDVGEGERRRRLLSARSASRLAEYAREAESRLLLPRRFVHRLRSR